MCNSQIIFNHIESAFSPLCGFSKELLTVNELLVESGRVMLKKMKSPTHCLHMLLPPNKKLDYNLRNMNPMFYPSVPPVPINVP